MPKVIKVSFKNDLRRITLSSSEKSMLQVVINKTAATSGVSADSLSFSYVDDEGDVIRVLTEQGLQEAMRVCEGKTLKLKAEVVIINDDKPAAPVDAPAPAAAAAWRKQVVAEASSSDAAAGQPLDRLAAVEKFVSSVAQAPIALAVQDNVNKDSDEKEEKEESPDDSPPSAQFVRDVTVPDGQKRVCNTTVVKTWALQNNGASVWPRGCTLLYSKGMVVPCEGNDHASPVPEALPNEVVNVSVEVRVPELPGRHHGEYTLVGPDGRTPFLKHHKIWVDVRAYESKPLAEVAKEAAKDAAKEVQRMFESIKKGAVLPPLTSSPSQEKQEKQPQHEEEAPLQMSPLSLQEDEDDEEVVAAAEVAAPAPFEVEEEEQKRDDDDDDDDDEVVKPSSITAAEPEALSSLSSAKKEMESQCAALLATLAGMVDEDTDLQRIQAATELVQRATASLLVKKAEPAEDDNGDNVDVDQVSPKQASCDEEGDGSLNDEDLNKIEKEAGKGKSWVQSLLPSFMTRQAVVPKEKEEEEASAEAVPAPEEPREEKRDDDDVDKEEEQVVVVEKKQPQPPSQPKPKLEAALRARFTRDVTIPDGTSLPVGDAAIKTWEFRNEGSQRWPAGTTLMHVGGGLAPQSGQKQVVLSEAQLAAPGELSQLSVPLTASGEGRQVGFYQLAIPNGMRFGTRVWVDITGVEPSVEDQVVEEKAAQVADEQPAEEEEKPHEEQQSEAQVDVSNDSGSESEDAAMGWEVVAAPVESQDEEDNDDAEEEAVAVEEVEVEEEEQEEQEQKLEAEQPQVQEPEPVVAQPEPVAAEAPQDEVPVRAEPAAAQPAAQPADDMQHKLSQLAAMGFQDNELNTDLLRDAKGDLQRVINWLVNQA